MFGLRCADDNDVLSEVRADNIFTGLLLREASSLNDCGANISGAHLVQIESSLRSYNDLTVLLWQLRHP